MQRDIGPGALLSLVGGALRLDPATFRRVADDPTIARLCYAVVVLASLANGFGYAMEGVADGMLGERDFALYRLLVLVGVVESVLQFTLFSGVVWLARIATRRRPVLGFAPLTRLLGLAMAPVCFVFLGPLLGFTTAVRGALTVWRIACCVVALRTVTESSWLGAIVTVLAADLLAAPLVSLVLFGWQSGPAPGDLPV